MLLPRMPNPSLSFWFLRLLSASFFADSTVLLVVNSNDGKREKLGMGVTPRNGIGNGVSENRVGAERTINGAIGNEDGGRAEEWERIRSASEPLGDICKRTRTFINCMYL